MPSDQQTLSHEEVWDDSALIDSWNEALAEYKKYHSIFAKGGSIRDLPQAQDLASNKSESSDPSPEDAQPGQTESAEQEPAVAAAPVAPSPQAILGSSMPFSKSAKDSSFFTEEQEAQKKEQNRR